MIINENNKNILLKGKIKRGFNQTPDELTNKIINQRKKEIKEKNEEETNIDDYFKLKKARNNLKRF